MMGAAFTAGLMVGPAYAADNAVLNGFNGSDKVASLSTQEKDLKGAGWVYTWVRTGYNTYSLRLNWVQPVCRMEPTGYGPGSYMRMVCR